MVNNKKPGLFSAITLGVGSVIGSGWLFASYYGAKYAGPIVLVSWVLGALVALILALLLAEIATIYPENGLLSRLLTFAYNRDIGFITAISNWFIMVSVAPSEATATVQYLCSTSPKYSHYIFNDSHLTGIGIIIVCFILAIYTGLNYWGIRTLVHANNLITTLKMIVPVMVGLFFMAVSFHRGNFTRYHNTIAPYGISRVFTAVVNCGIFYAFYGFTMVTVFARELHNPKRNLPLALIGSVAVCLLIYLVLQVSFLVSIPPNAIADGWHHLSFDSPLANLAIALGINWLAIVLYVDAVISPSGTGVIYLGSGTRMLTAMADDQQLPKIFARMNQEFFISRTSLIFSAAISFVLVIFFQDWQSIMIVVTAFQLISCLAIPLAFAALRNNKASAKRLFVMPGGKVFSLLAYLVVTYLLVQCGLRTIVLTFCCHVVFFGLYCIISYQKNVKAYIAAFMSSWSMYMYLLGLMFFANLQDHDKLASHFWLLVFLVYAVLFYRFFLRQKNYNL